MLPPAHASHCSTMAVASTWTKTTANTFKLSAKAPKILLWELGAEYGQTYTSAEGGTITDTYQTSAVSTVTTLISP
jgi:hypothetical protein